MKVIMSKSSWQMAMTHAITDPIILWEKLALPPALLPKAQKAATLFGLKVPESFLARIEKGNPHDPLLLQILPLGAELIQKNHFEKDPLQEKNFNPLPGLLHKYKSRVLITLLGTCAVNCRYCFRREFPYAENNPGKKGLEAILHYIEKHPEISEVILSGGDPLVASDSFLKLFCEKLSAIPSVKTLRFHTRMPVVIPDRITPSFIQLLKNLPYRKVIVFHINHPNEINETFIQAIYPLREAGVTLLNQSVLLKNINDDAKVLTQLSERLFDAGILPYYLHLLDKVKGTSHFNVTDSKAKKLRTALQAALPGYLVPRLMREVPGEKHKVMI
jgi:EF-P beta-lysylation protein EpmB